MEAYQLHLLNHMTYFLWTLKRSKKDIEDKFHK